MKIIKSLFIKLIILKSILEISIGIFVNPKISLINNIISSNKNDVLYNLSYTSLVLGVMSLIILFMLKHSRDYWINISLIFIILSSIILLDRIILAKVGLPLWEYDAELHYRHRPNKNAIWQNGKRIQINAKGNHDIDRNAKKERDEYRIFNIGDSIVMGHEVERTETFSFLLNGIKLTKDSLIINSYNLGVQGYSTFQNRIVLLRNLNLMPDHIMLGICLNDFTEPYVVNKKYGGSGIDYHQVVDIENYLVQYFYNETGFGRLIQKQRFSETLRKMKRVDELTAVEDFVNNITRPEYKNRLTDFSQEIKMINDICIDKNIKLSVVIFPYTFQFFNRVRNSPQYEIKRILKSLDIEFLDLLDELNVYAQDNKVSVDDIIRINYLDEDHFTVKGHKLVANIICNRLLDN
ncbi:MAG: SGNH/GDSL hydrolase family protein [Ignavibacteriaceae bacterium]|nr:SGNH/GDSL hydrolase family protein [Ignavibacteriaceae bacterium]